MRIKADRQREPSTDFADESRLFKRKGKEKKFTWMDRIDRMMI